MAPGICFVLLLLGSSAPLASCVGKFIRKEAKTAVYHTTDVSYVLSPSGAISESLATGGNLSSVSSLSDYGGPALVNTTVVNFNTSECQVDFQRLESICSAGNLCSPGWGTSTPGPSTKLAYAAALLAGGADLADSLPLSMFSLPVHTPLADEDRSSRTIPWCERTPGCLDLRIDDPSGWCCPCMANMMEKCAGVNQTCFRDQMCNHSQVSKVWKGLNNCTVAQVDNGCAECQASFPPPLLTINLGAAGGFALLTKTGITTTGQTHVTGNMGVSPAAASYVTGFALTMDASNKFSTSALVNGSVYAKDYTVTTPNVNTAILDMVTAYNDAAGRVPPYTTELGEGDINGMTMTPVGGVHKWASSVTISSSLIFDARDNPDMVWILQIAGNLVLGDNAQVTLSNGAKASNIFWQVAGQTRIPAGAHLEGIILCQTSIIFGDGGSLNGRGLAQTMVSLIGNTIVAPPSPSLLEDGNSASLLNVRASSLASKSKAEGNSLDETLEDKCSSENR